MKVAVRIYNTSGGGQYDVPSEGDVVAWMKSEGERVVKGDVLCELEIEKGVVEIVAPASGTFVNIAYPVGKTWMRGEVGEIIENTAYYDPPFCWIETDEIVTVPPRESVSMSVADEPVVVPVVPKPPPDRALSMRGKRTQIFATRDELKKLKPRTSAGALRLMQEANISNEELFNFFGGNIGVFTEYHIKRLLEKRGTSIPLRRDAAVTSDLAQKEMINSVKEPTMELRVHVEPPDFAASRETFPNEVKAVPLARTIAREKEIDIAHVQGSGPDGLILVCDVEQKSAQEEIPETISAQQSVAELPEEPVLLTMPRLWRTIAKNMEMGILIPTVDARTDGRRFNIRRLTELYDNSRQSFKKIWLPLMVAYARVLGNERFTIFNSCWHERTDSAGTVTPYVAARKYVHMGIAYDRGELPIIDWGNKTIRGERLRILTVRNAHLRSLKDITSEVERLFEAAAQKRFSLQDTSGYTAIFNNLGVLRHHSGRSILTAGIASMLNLGLVDMESGEAMVQSVVDHRLIDGAKTAPFFIALYKELMQRVLPELEALLLERK